MARLLRTPAGLVLAGALLLLAIAYAASVWRSYRETSVVTEPEDGGPVVTQVVSARMAGMSALKVAELSGTIQARAEDVRLGGILKSSQIVKMPYSVDYFVDMGGLGEGALSWDAENRTMVVDAPDVAPGRPNTDEGARSLVETSGVYVTRGAGEALARQTSQAAARQVATTAQSPQRMAQAREHGRRAIAQLVAPQLAALGYPDARVIVTFPPERPGRAGEPADRSRNPDDVVANRF